MAENIAGFILLSIPVGIFLFVWSCFTYHDHNLKHCEKLDEGFLPQYFRIVRNGDGTISLLRKELFNLWNIIPIELGEINVKSLEDYPEFENHIKKIIDKKLAIAKKHSDYRKEMNRLAKNQKNKPFISFSKPKLF